jgi:outer membrane protein assembly factor BamB
MEFRLPSGEPAALIVAGSCLQAIASGGTVLWTDFHSVITKVLHVAQTGHGPIALTLSRERDVRLIDLTDGSIGWRYQAPPGTNLSGPGSSKLVPDRDGWCWLVAPSYSESISCFEITSATNVRNAWVHDFAGRYDRGFGPVMVVADVLNTGDRQVLISSRTGSGYGADDADADVPTERVVLGRADGHLYQAVLDLGDGSIRAEVAYRPDPGDYPCARPYGLLQVTGGASERVAVLVSCQVEEFYSATRISDGTLSRAWGEFVEKDWPLDEQELRPQTSSVVSADSNAPVLVTGHFNSSGWTTVLRCALTGRQVGAVPGHYFWGTVRSGAGELAIVSPAGTRQLDGTELLRAARVDDPECISDGRPLRPVTCSNDVLPPEISFHADRRTLVQLADAAGRTGILTTHASRGLCWWEPATDEVRTLADLDVIAGYPGLDGAVLVVSRDGRVYRISTDLEVGAQLAPLGRRPEGFAAVAGGTPWVLTPTGAGATVARTPAASRTLAGQVAAIAVQDGTLLAATITDSARVLLIRCRTDGFHTSGSFTQLCSIAFEGTPNHALFVEDPDRLVVSERTGVHTAAIGVYELDGRMVWRDGLHGPHPNLPMAAMDGNGRWRVAYDDHGELVVRDAHTGEQLAERDWTAAYTTPALVSSTGQDWLLRLGGVHGIEAVELDLSERWRHTATLWRYFPGEAAVADRGNGPVIASAGSEGVLDIFDAATGRLVHTVDIGPVAARPPVVAVDLDGDGYHEFVAGTAAGQLVTVDPDSGQVRPWPVSFPAAVEYLAVADTNGDGFSDLIVGTADGEIHLMSGGGSVPARR